MKYIAVDSADIHTIEAALNDAFSTVMGDKFDPMNPPVRRLGKPRVGEKYLADYVSGMRTLDIAKKHHVEQATVYAGMRHLITDGHRAAHKANK